MSGAWRRQVRGPTFQILVAMLIAAIICVQGYELYRSYQATWLLAQRSAENVLHSLASNIDRNLYIVELSLIGLESAAVLDGLDSLNPQTRSMLLFDRAASAQFLGAMLVLNEKGDIRFDSSAMAPRAGNFLDRDYFQFQLEPGRGTFVSRPFPSRLQGGEASVAMSRRITRPDGTFAGIAVGSIRMAFFRKLFSQIDLGPDSVIAVMRSDGILIYRYPQLGSDTRVGTDISSSSVFQKLVERPGEPFTDRSVLDGIRRYYVSSSIGSYPILLTVGISTDAAMREWNAHALTTLAMTFAICALLALLFRTLRRALQRSQQMEEQLEIMAVTDALTAIPNRRAFDMAFANELRRAARDGTQLSILMIDIDHFKKVNDLYGHAAGDEVLRRLAKQIADNIRRPGDFAARYGGEEFVVMLPATDAVGAQMVGEKIRRAISVMTPNPNTPSLQQVTVSIGVASQHVSPDEAPGPILHAADAALYTAKAAGRNRLAMSPGIAATSAAGGASPAPAEMFLHGQ